MRVHVRVRAQKILVAWRTQRANLELRTPNTRRNSNQTIHNAQQRTAGYGAKKLINLIRFYRLYPCFRLGVSTQRREPCNNNTTIKQEAALVLRHFSYHYCKYYIVLKCWYFKNCGYQNCYSRLG